MKAGIILENQISAPNWKRVRFIIIISYVLIIAVLYVSFTISAKGSADKRIRDDMTGRLDSVMTSIDASFEIKLVEIKSLVQNDSLRNPLLYKIDYAINEFAGSTSSSNRSFNKIIIADSQNNIMYNNTAFFKNLSEIPAKESAYSDYIYNSRLFRCHYEPVESKAGKIGSLITFYDFSDFSNAASESLESSPYVLYGFFNGSLDMLLDKTGIYFFKDKPIKAITETKLDEGFTTLVINEESNFLLLRKISLSNSHLEYLLAASAPISYVMEVENQYLRSSLLQCTLTALLITLILAFMWLGARHFINKEFANRLEIKNLRTQRHDFVKHLNIIGGMAATGEFVELTHYVESLGKRVVFESTLAKLDNPPANVLIQEKQLEASENGISFEVSVKTGLGNLNIDSTDLCTILANLMDNAIEACMEADPSQRSIAFEVGNKDKQYYFKISNTGKGIQEKNIERLFQPGFSTKSGQNNSGMGLYIVKRLLRKYRGSIRVEGNGGITSFIVFFPE